MQSHFVFTDVVALVRSLQADASLHRLLQMLMSVVLRQSAHDARRTGRVFACTLVRHGRCTYVVVQHILLLLHHPSGLGYKCGTLVIVLAAIPNSFQLSIRKALQSTPNEIPGNLRSRMQLLHSRTTITFQGLQIKCMVYACLTK
jgi:hypothetical protein